MKKFILLSIFALTLSACKNDKKVEVVTPTSTESMVQDSAKIETTNALLQEGCYEYNNNGNKVKMEITKVADEVTGNLNTEYSGKDSNKGTFVGKLNGDKLIGTYTFNSEGKSSSREVAYQVKDGQLIEGYGDLDDATGTKFKDVNTIQYSSKMPLVKVECTK